MLLLLRRGVPSMMGGTLSEAAAIWDRKVEMLSSTPEMEPGLLLALDLDAERSNWRQDPEQGAKWIAVGGGS